MKIPPVLDVFRMPIISHHSTRRTNSRAAPLNRFNYHGSSSNDGIAAYLHILDNAGIRPNVNIIPNPGSVSTVAPYRAALADVHVITNNGSTANDRGETVTDVEPPPNLRS